MQLQIESLTRRLLAGDLGIPENPEERFAFLFYSVCIFPIALNRVKLILLKMHFINCVYTNSALIAQWISSNEAELSLCL